MASDPVATAACPSCGAAFEIAYVRLGSSVRCATCEREVVAAVPAGGFFPVTRWELHYGDFVQLTRDASYRDVILPLFAKWFGATLPDPIDSLALHLRIQDDPEKQYALYQAAMSLWR
jgi:hypothetical protein